MLLVFFDPRHMENSLLLRLDLDPVGDGVELLIPIVKSGVIASADSRR